MNIAIPQDSSYPVLDNLATTLAQIPGVEPTVWIPQHKPIFDMLEEIKPEWILCPSNMLTPTFISATKEYNVKLILLGLYQPNIPNVRLVCVDENTPDKLLENFKQSRLKTDLISYYKLKPATNLAQLHSCTYNEKYESDILYFSDTDISKSPYIYETLIKLTSLDKYKIKVCGKQKINMNEYMGVPTLQETRGLLASTKILLDFDTAMVYDCAISKTFCLSNTPQHLYPSYVNPGEMLAQVDHFVNDDKHRKHFTQLAYKNVVGKDTFFHRIRDILDILDMSELGSKAMEILDKTTSIKGNN